MNGPNEALFWRWKERYGNGKREIRVIIAGTRTYADYQTLRIVSDTVIGELRSMTPDAPVTIISGDASGADTLGKRYAKERGYLLKRFPVDWKLFGKMAGPVRNRQMLEYAKAGLPVLIAFWDGVSRGTKNMITIAEDAGAAVFVKKI